MKPLSIQEREVALAAYVPHANPGQVLIEAKLRLPYQTTESTVYLDTAALPRGLLGALLASHSSRKTASTSELLGLVSKLRAMALAVRNRSYVLTAASISRSDALLRCIDCKRVSNSSVRSFTFMGALSVVEVVTDSHRKAGQGARQPYQVLA